MNRALIVLTCGAFVTLLVESTALADPLPAIALAAVYAALSVFGFGWIDRQEPPVGAGWPVCT